MKAKEYWQLRWQHDDHVIDSVWEFRNSGGKEKTKIDVTFDRSKWGKTTRISKLI